MHGVGRVSGALAAVAVLWLAGAGHAGAAESDFYSGLAYLRAGAQLQAEQHLTKYRDEEPDPSIRRTIDRVLPLLKQPLSENLRDYIAATLEENARPRPPLSTQGARPAYASRMFPVFP